MSRIFGFIVALSIAGSLHAAVYVDVANPGAGSGTQADPYRSIRAAVAGAANNDTIFIADGMYDDAIEDFSGSGEIEIPSGLTLMAGYVGLTGGSPDWSNRTATSTIVDLDGVTNTRAFFSQSAATPTLDGFTFQNANHNNGTQGGAVKLGQTFSQGGIVRNSIFQNNVTNGDGGGLYFGGNSDVATVQNVQFIDNRGARGGGLGMSVPNSMTVSLSGMLFSGNTASGEGGGLFVSGGSNFVVSESTFSGNQASDGGAIALGSGDLNLTRATITDNTAAKESAINAWSFQDVDVVLENVLIAGNTSTNNGYAIEVGSNSPGSLQADFITVADNTGAGAIHVHEKGSAKDEVLRIFNSIIDGDGSGTGILTDIDASGTIDLDYNNVFNFATLYGGTAAAGPNSISADPLFFDPVSGDYHLLLGSPSIDAADPASTVSIDLDGDSRPVGPVNDQGAFEGGVIPEPATLALLGLGAATILTGRRRR